MGSLTRGQFVAMTAASLLAPVAACAQGSGASEPSAACAQGGGALEPGASAPRTFVVMSDPHYISPRLVGDVDTFAQVVSTGDGKVMLKIDALLDAFVAQMRALAPDAIIISGDMSFNGALESHVALAAKLAPLLEEGIRIAVIPGNHDIDYPFAARFEQGRAVRVRACGARDFREVWQRFGYDDALCADEGSLSYVYPLYQDVWLLMLDCNGADGLDWGALSAATVAWCEQVLAAARQAGVRVIGVSHQNLLCHCALFGGTFMVDCAPELEELYASNGVRLNLSGHIHIQHTMTGEFTCDDDARLFECVTSSLAVTPCQYGVVTLDDVGAAHFSSQVVDVVGWAREQGLDDPDLLDFAYYAADFFENCSRVKPEPELLAAGLAPEDARAGAKAIAHANRCYFAGRTDLIDWDDPALVRALGKTSLDTYLKIVRSEQPCNHTRFDLVI